MSSKWPMVLLGDVLNLNIDSIKVEPNVYYKISGIYSFGRGLLAREPLLGAETTYKVFHRLHENDFVISHLKAWEGAIAPVTASFDGWFLSPQFSTFRPDPERLEISFLEWYCKQSKVWEDLRNKSRGMGARRDSVSPSQFLALSIPLPPIDEQGRIVARIKELAARIEEARELRRRAVEEIEALKRSYLRDYFLIVERQRGNIIPLGELVIAFGGGTPSKHNAAYWDGNIPWVSPKDMTAIEIIDSEDHITKDAISESSTSLVPRNSVLIVARSGILRRTIPVAINRVPVTINQDLKALVPNSDVIPEYIRWWIKANEAQVLLCVKGGTTVQSLVWKKVMGLGICVPTVEEQHRVVEHLDRLQSKLDALRRHQSETAAALDALLPAVLERAFRGEL